MLTTTVGLGDRAYPIYIGTNLLQGLILQSLDEVYYVMKNDQ